ncbi:MAG: ribulose 1,5-bisphosphate carboxylase [Hyphomicrobiales bacterium]|nr:ribulose 1,5-bisphosphate carboxylase [Hyphomicrobiales bacterium]
MRLNAIYQIRCDADEIERKAKAIAVEQSVEMPLEAIDDPYVLDTVVGRLEAIEEQGTGNYRVTISLDPETVGEDAGQLMNMLFGNSSLHEDVSLLDVIFPDAILDVFEGPASGIAGLRERVEAPDRPLTCSALKPQGLSGKELAQLAYRFALGRIDYIKDDHGLADQSYSPFWERVRHCSDAVIRATDETGHPTRYAPSLSGNLDQLRSQVSIAQDHGLDTVMISPMVVGFSAFAAITEENADMAFFAHPAMGGAARIAPPLLIGKLFRLLGADAVIFPNFGGRFGYSRQTCMSIGSTAKGALGDCRPSMPVPAGGMTLDRLEELTAFYGVDCMILIGGNLLMARENLTAETLAFTRCIEDLKSEKVDG